MMNFCFRTAFACAALCCALAFPAAASARGNAVPGQCLVDLHLHLDGSLSLETARALAAMQNLPIPSGDAELRALLQAPENCASLNDYLKCFDFPLTLLQTKEAISESVFRLKEELKAQGLIYAEIRFAPQLHTAKGLTQEEAVLAAMEGNRRSSLKSGLILCCMRGPDVGEKNMLTAEVAGRYLGKGVCAIDLAGAEALFPTAGFGPVFEYARERRIPFTIHAGEADGPESVRAALSFGAKRIGHGVRSCEDLELMAELARERIALELCPTSNLNTKIFAKIEDYPLMEFLRAGVPVTINTDNMSVSNTTARRELQLIADTFQLGAEAVKQLLLNAAEASFTDRGTKAELIQKIERTFASH